MSKYRKLMIMVALVAALAMLATMTGVSFASGGDGTSQGKPTTCVVGYVINHRELAVDGTKFDPQMSVMYLMSPEQVQSLAVAAPAEATAPMTATVPAAATTAAPEAPAALAPSAFASAAMAPTSVPVNSTGYFEIQNLPAEYWYDFGLQLPPDWSGIVPQAGRGAIAETGWTQLPGRDPKHCHVVVFKIKRNFDVTVLKWEELQNGTVQPGKGWAITATPQNDLFAVKQTGTTDANGGTVLTLTPGTWTIAETVKSGWTPVTPASVSLTLDQYAPPGATDPVIFKNRKAACYAKIVVEKNGLGTDAYGGTVWLGPLAGWQITLSRPDGLMTTISKTTDGSGKTTFSNLTPGVYNVKETVQGGWKAISPNPQQVVIRDCETARVLFENQEIVGKLKITGRKLFQAWVKPYAGQIVGLSGWTIKATLKGSNPSVYATTTTDALGNYVFDSSTPGFSALQIAGATIRVCEEQRDHWIPVTATCVDVTFPYPVPVTYTGVVVNFTNMQDPPPGAAGAALPSAAPGASCASTYQVRSGDTLSGIAAQYGASTSALAQANGISNPNYVRAGQVLCVQ